MSSDGLGLQRIKRLEISWTAATFSNTTRGAPVTQGAQYYSIRSTFSAVIKCSADTLSSLLIGFAAYDANQTDYWQRATEASEL